MKKQLLAVCICFLFGTEAFADIMGPPTAGVKKGQWSAGFDYSYTEMDLEHDGDYSYDIDDGSFTGTEEFSYELENNEMHKAYLNIGYGICDQ